MKAYLYARVSPTNMPGELRAETQLADGEEYCRKLGQRISGSYVDVETSRSVPIEDREEGARLLRDMARDVARGESVMVVVRMFDRLGEGVEMVNAFRALDRLGGRVRSVHESHEPETPSGLMLLLITAGVAAQERGNTRIRTWSGILERARKGKGVGGVVLYGYRVNEEGFWEPDKAPFPDLPEWSEAKVVRAIYDWFLKERLSASRIAERLTLLSIPTPTQSAGRGKPRASWNAKSDFWQADAVCGILTDETYAGTHYWGKTKNVRDPQRPGKVKKVAVPREQWIPQPVPPILTHEEQARVRPLLTANRLFSDKNKKHFYLLTGRVRCRACGQPYFGSYPSERNGYYCCQGRHAPLRCFGPGQRACRAPRVRIDQLESQVWAVVLWHLEHLDETLVKLREQQDAQARDSGSLLEIRDGIRRTLDRKEQERRLTVDRSTTVGPDGKPLLTEDEVAGRLMRLREEEEKLRVKLAELDVAAAALEQHEAKLAETADYLRAWKDRLAPPFTPEEKREAVRNFVEVIWIDEQERGTVAKVRLRFDPEETGVYVPTDPATVCQ